MKKTYTLLFLLIFCSCNPRAYYLSPFNINCNTYYARPMLADSVKSAIYGSVLLTNGTANDNAGDAVYNGQLSLHRSHTAKHIQVYYGANLALGAYKTGTYSYNGNIAFLNQDEINGKSGSKFFGGGWLNGGVNLVIPIKQHEFRVLGIESSLGKEWGSYYDFRKGLSDSAASSVFRDDRFGSVGLSTEMVFRARKAAVGMKFAYGESFYRNLDKGRSVSKPFYLERGYYSTTFSLTKQYWTISAQLNAGVYASSAQLGFSYRLH